MIKTTIREKYERYIGTLKDTISKFQLEWDTLYESYHLLLADIKKLIIDNEKLKSLVLDLEEKIDTHNKTTLSSDTTIRQQIELLTRHTLSKKTIDWMSQKEVLVRSAGEMEALNTKVRRLEMKEYNSSSLLNSVAVDMENFVNEGRSVSVSTTRTITCQDIIDNGVRTVEVRNSNNLNNGNYTSSETVVESGNPFSTSTSNEERTTQEIIDNGVRRVDVRNSNNLNNSYNTTETVVVSGNPYSTSTSNVETRETVIVSGNSYSRSTSNVTSTTTTSSNVYSSSNNNQN
jgi:hypothetical protein